MTLFFFPFSLSHSSLPKELKQQGKDYIPQIILPSPGERSAGRMTLLLVIFFTDNKERVREWFVWPQLSSPPSGLFHTNANCSGLEINSLFVLAPLFRLWLLFHQLWQTHTFRAFVTFIWTTTTRKKAFKTKDLWVNFSNPECFSLLKLKRNQTTALNLFS